MLLQLIRLFAEQPLAGALSLLHVVKFPLGIALIFVILAPWMYGFTRWLRGEQLSEGEGLLRWLLLAALVPFLLTVIAFL